MEKFRPLSPDPYLVNDEDMSLAKFGHINALVDAINAVIPSGTGLMYQSQYDPFNSGVVKDSYLFSGLAPSYYLNRANHTGTQSQATITGLVGDLALKGDMFRSVYDPNLNGVVDNSERLNGQLPSYYLNRANHTGTQTISTIVNLQTSLDAKLDDSQLGVDIATLTGGLIPLAQLPFAATAYLGTYNGTTNTPALVNGVGVAGQYLITTVAGAAGPMGAVNIGDVVVYDGAVWQVGPPFAIGVASVNGNGGPVVVLDLDDISDGVTRAAITPAQAAGIAASPTAINVANPAASIADITTLTLALGTKGDMFKSTYDINNNGIVDNAERLGGQLPAFYTNRANHTGTQAQSTVTNLITDLAAKIPLSQKGAASGVCELDINGFVPASRLNLAALNYKNSWDVFANSPSLANGIGNVGDTYIVGYAGPTPPFTRNLGSGNISWNVGDLAIYNGTIWQKVSAPVAGVTSVNALTGVVTLNSDQIPQGSTNFYLTAAQNGAVDNANAPTNLNPFATIADITPIETDVITLQGNITTINGQLALKENKSEKGVALGYCDLDASGKIPASRLNFSAFNYQNSWNALTNSPALADGVGTAGNAYIVGTAGTQNLGSGAITFNVGDLVIYNGTVWQKITGVPAGVSSVNGFSGAVTLTADNVAETASRFYVNANQNAALDAASSASGANRFATMADLTTISVGGSYFNAETYSDNQTLGDGTLRTLASLGYTNGSAAATWTRVAADPRFTINVATMSIDWIAHQEAMLAMEQNGFNGFTAPGGRGYCFNQTCLLPRDQTAINFYRRSFIFKYNFNGSAFANRTGTNFPFFEKMPANQAEANGLRLVYKYFFDSAAYYGNNSANANDCFIRLGATSSSQFKNLEGAEMGIFIDTQFCLQVAFENINVGSFGLYGITARNGTWTGWDPNNSQCNNASVYNYHSYNGSGKTPTSSVFTEGNRLISLNKMQFEGVSGSQHHILHNWNGATTTKQVMRITDMDIESAGASRAGIRIIGNGSQVILDGFNNQVGSGDMPVLVEAEANGYPAYSPIHMMIRNAASDFHSGWKFRHTANVNFDIKWYIEKVRLANNASVINASNWDTSLPSTFIPAIGSTYYVPVL